MSDPIPSPPAPFTITRAAAPVRSQVEYHLRQAILSGRFRPGDRLIERELCELLGVSRTPLREALRFLENQRLVVNIPQRGLVVATMTLQEAEEIYQVRAAVEGQAGRLFAERANGEHQAALQGALSAVEVALQSAVVPTLAAAKDHFYAVLLAGSGNRTLTTIADSLRDRIAWLRYLTLAQPARADQSVKEMRRILVAVLARNYDEASTACIEHVEAAAVVAKQVFHQRDLSIRPASHRPPPT
jgi:DNA-binding GntR family transcriptional regulator